MTITPRPFSAGNVKTLTLFVHGEKDMRVNQGRQANVHRAEKTAHHCQVHPLPPKCHEGWPPWDMVHRCYQATGWWQEHLK